MILARRSFIAGMAASFSLLSKTATAAATNAATAAATNVAVDLPPMHVIKGRGCGCCTAWVELLQKLGMQITFEEIHPAELIKVKHEKKVPVELASCHTADIAGYVIEGHVPFAEISRLIAEKPEAVGLSVPGMPYGSPGMGPHDQREAYDVMLIKKDGSWEVYKHYNAA